jgi:hypothetical protein
MEAAAVDFGTKCEWSVGAGGGGGRGARYEFFKFVLPQYIHRLSIFVDQPTNV